MVEMRRWTPTFVCVLRLGDGQTCGPVMLVTVTTTPNALTVLSKGKVGQDIALRRIRSFHYYDHLSPIAIQARHLYPPPQPTNTAAANSF